MTEKERRIIKDFVIKKYGISSLGDKVYIKKDGFVYISRKYWTGNKVREWSSLVERIGKAQDILNSIITTSKGE